MNDTPSIKILLADDDKDDCLFFQEALRELTPQTRFEAVNDGDQLMSRLTTGTNQLPTVLFLDLNMPRKNGFKCLEEIKSNENLKQIPVIIVSTSYDGDMADLLYNGGAHFYIRKPADFAQLKNVIGHSLHLILEKKITQPPRENFYLET